MSKSNAFETSHLQHVFQNAAIANIGDASGLQPSSADGSLFVALHTAWPGETGDQSTNEAAYTSYARVGVSRNGATGWTVSGNNVSNTALVQFPTATGGSETEFFASIGVASSGATVILYIVKMGTRLGTGVVDANGVTNNDFSLPSHGLVADDRVAFFTRDGEALPTGITEGQVYWVISTGLATDTFRFSATQAGAAIDITAVGQAHVFQMVGLAVSNGIRPEFSAGDLDVFEN